MITFPHAKVNLGLHVLRLRPDGYRDMESVLLPIPLHDALEVVVDPGLPAGEVVMVRTGRPVPGDPQLDLCVKAAKALGRDRVLPGLRVHLHKEIPIGAGLGGGSSDGAHALALINEQLQLGVPNEELALLAAGLGSDCPFFLRQDAQLATGRGEVLKPVTLDLSGWWLMLLNPGIHVSTAQVYAHTPLAPATCDLRAVVQNTPPEEWTGRVVNVMEEYVLRTYPEVQHALDKVTRTGAVYSAMSGSGSSVFGLFRHRPVLPALTELQSGWVLAL
jgi:4-diphosphocytidyl-2-C-methyl-D-erythritol kinase